MQLSRSVICPALLLMVLPLQAADEEFRPLWNGKDLTGWQRVNTDESTWTIQDGMLICTGKPIGELRTDRMYQNFILEVEWRHMKPKGNAGIFVWADDITARGVPFHRSIEVQVLENAYGNTNSHTTHGDIFPIHGATMTPINGRGGSRAFPTESRSLPSPEWNHYRIVCNDGEISLAVNGKVVTRGKDCSPRKGYICIESEGGIVHYRNMRIRELPDTPVESADIAIADRGYRCLYTGIDLEGWELPESGQPLWRPQDWILAYTGDAGTAAPLSTKKEFGNVGFLVDVRFSQDSRPLQLSLRGATCRIAPDSPGTEPIGGWNRIEGQLRGSTLTVTVNGQPVEVPQQVGVLDSGPFTIRPDGPASFANIFVRELR
jgi:hypothetical protein